MDGKGTSEPGWIDGVQYPAHAWLRGYFTDVSSDTAGAQKVTGFKKNVDFLRLKDFTLHLLDPRPGMKILDVGCANGASMVYCGLQGAEVFGQDLDAAACETANENLTIFGITGEAVVGDAAELRFPDHHFDAVISNDFFEHVRYDLKVRVLREIRRVLKPGRPLVLRTPNLSYLRTSRSLKRLRAVFRLQNPRKYIIAHSEESDDPQHIGLTTRKEMTRAFMEAGFVNHRFHYAPLRRFGASYAWEVLSTEIPVLRDRFSEDLVCTAYCPITLTHFPD